MEAAGMACVALFIPCLLVSAIIALVGGGIGTIATRKNKDARIISIAILLVGVCLAIYVGRAFVPTEFWLNLRPSYQLGDEKLEPYKHAITDINRASLGFTPIPTDAKIKILNNQEGYVYCPDVELYIPDLPFKRQHICLEKVGEVYVWYKEFEVYLGPEEWDTLWFAYSSTSGVLGGVDDEPYVLIIEYRGPEDPRYQNKDLSREDVQPIIDEWRRYHLSTP